MTRQSIASTSLLGVLVAACGTDSSTVGADGSVAVPPPDGATTDAAAAESDASSSPTPLVTGESVRAPVSDGEVLHWVNVGTGEIRRLDLLGGAPTTIATVPGAWDIAVDLDRVYVVTTEGMIASLPRSGGAVQVLAEGQSAPRSPAVYQSWLYWAESGIDRVNRVATSGGAIETVLSGEIYPREVAVGPGGVFVSTLTGRLVAVPHAGGGATVLAGEEAGAAALALGDTHVYFGGGNGTSLSRVLMTGGPVETMVPNIGVTDLVVLEEGSVYWTDFGGGTVWSVSPGGEFEARAQMTYPEGISADDTSVFVANGIGEIWRLPR